MSQVVLSESLRQFLLVYIHTFEELELLLLARRLRGADLELEKAASSINVDAELAGEALAKLASFGLLRVVSQVPLVYAYAEESALADHVEELAAAYDEQRLAVVTQVSSNAIVRVRTAAIRTFAEAFMLRKGPKK